MLEILEFHKIERVIIVGNKNGIVFDFTKLKYDRVESMKPFLDQNGDFEILPKDSYTILKQQFIKKQPKSGLIFCGYRNKKIRTVGVRPETEHLSRVHKQPNRIYSVDGIHPTLTSQEASGRYFIKDGDLVRKLTMQECFKFMGFPVNYKTFGSLANLYARVGNSICVNMVSAVAEEVVNQFFL